MTWPDVRIAPPSILSLTPEDLFVLFHFTFWDIGVVCVLDFCVLTNAVAILREQHLFMCGVFLSLFLGK